MPSRVSPLTGSTIDNGKDGYAVFTFVEEPDKFVNGGTLLSKMAFEWVKAFDGNITDASEELAACGGVRVRLSTKDQARQYHYRRRNREVITRERVGGKPSTRVLCFT